MKESADLLVDYTKKATVSSPVNNGAIVDAIVSSIAIFHLVVNPPLATHNRPKRKHTQSTRILKADYSI